MKNIVKKLILVTISLIIVSVLIYDYAAFYKINNQTAFSNFDKQEFKKVNFNGDYSPILATVKNVSDQNVTINYEGQLLKVNNDLKNKKLVSQLVKGNKYLFIVADGSDLVDIKKGGKQK